MPNFILDFFLRCHKDIANLPGYFGHAWTNPWKITVSTFTFISMENINFVTRFFLVILQKHCIIVILSTLGIPGHTHQKGQYQFIENSDAHVYKKSTSSFTSFMRYCKEFSNLLLWVIWAGLAMPTKINSINLKNSLMFICMHKINFSHPFLFGVLQRYY